MAQRLRRKVANLVSRKRFPSSNLGPGVFSRQIYKLKRYLYFIRRDEIMAAGKWLVIIGGLLAVISQFWGAGYYLALIGGLLAIIGAFVK